MAYDHIGVGETEGEAYANYVFTAEMEYITPAALMTYEVLSRKILWMIEFAPEYRNGILKQAKVRFPQFADRISTLELLI